MDWKKLLSEKRIRKSNKNPLDVRNEFESDFGRIIFSPALRRMHDKTQVFPLTSDDNIHSRLTHSNEVMSIGYTFGLKLSKSTLIQTKTEKKEEELFRILPVILKNVCLIHDIGNAPFGHFGETIVSNYFKKLNLINENFRELDPRKKRDFINYDGNAQGLRVLTKLQILNDSFGLNLTYATLASYLKYPNHEEINDNVEKKANDEGSLMEIKKIEKSKHGVFYSELDFFESIMKECGLENNGKYFRHPLSYLMEAADSIAYLCMDMEDGFNKDLFDINYIKLKFEKSTSEIAKKIVAECEKNYVNDNTKIVNIRIYLIDYLVNLAYTNFEKNIVQIEEGNYDMELINNDDFKIFKILKSICNEKIFTSREINFLETAGYSVFVGLLDYYIEFLFHDDKKYRNRAKSLISKSVIDTSIEENLYEIGKEKIQSIISKKEKQIELFKDKNKVDNLKKNLEELKNKTIAISEALECYNELNLKRMTFDLTSEEKNNLLEARHFIYFFYKEQLDDELKFEDLDNYYKFRVILDFISGMTDQYALNHFQKISGQKIN
jgi:dGTPase